MRSKDSGGTGLLAGLRARAWWPYLALVAHVGAWTAAATLLMQLPVWYGRSHNPGSYAGPLLLSGALVALVVVAGVALTRTLRWPLLVMVSLAVFVTAASHLRIGVLGQPVVPADARFLAHPVLLAELASPRTLLGGLAAATAVVLVLGWVIGRTTRRWEAPAPGRAWWMFRVVVVVAALAVVVSAARFNQTGNLLRRSYESVGAGWAAWSDYDNYRMNGFVAGALYTLPVEAMEPPEGYGPDAMADLVRRWAPEDPEAARAGLDGTNVVVVLSESMGELGGLSSVHPAEDPLRAVHELVSTGWGGQVPTQYGTGTATMEFTVLTGQSMGLFEPQVDSPYEEFVPERGPYPSVAGWLGSRGHRAVAIHGFTDELYRRPESYRALGFDEFLDIEDLALSPRAGVMNGVRDSALFGRVLDEIEGERDPVLAHVVTMQNHGPYSADSFGTLEVELDEPDPDTEARIGAWAAGLADSDRAVKQFLRDLRATGEPTLVVYFGDHFPGVMPQQVFEADGERTRRAPFFVWASDGDAERAPLGVVSSASLLEVALERAGAPAPGYLRLLRAVREEVGALTPGAVVSPDGTLRSYADLTERQRSLVEDLRMVQYDFSVGERYGLEGLWYPPR